MPFEAQVVTFLGLQVSDNCDTGRNTMKHTSSGLYLIAVTVVASTLALGAWGRRNADNPRAPASPTVVVELFTSEGCSSCPPADALLAKLAEANSASNVHVIALEEHVDYWDDQGWRDPFSSHDWTIRQNTYAGALGNGNPYTPQMVVDGSVEFSGGRPQQALKSIAEAGAHEKTAVTLTEGTSDKPGKENFSLQVGKLSPSPKGGGAEVWLAITETGLHSSVTRGENAGHELRHAAVVRSMRKIGEAKPDRDASFSADVNVPLRGDWKRENLKAVVFVQEKKSLKILGAAEVALRP